MGRDRLERHVCTGVVEAFSPLLPVLGALRDWGLVHIKGTEARMKPVL